MTHHDAPGRLITTILALGLLALLGGLAPLLLPDEAGTPGQGVAVTPEPTGDPGTPQLAWFYRPPADASARQVAQEYDRIILTRYDEPVRDRMRAAGAPGPFLAYLRMDAIMDDSGLGYTFGNQAAYEDGDWQRISAKHPDWFLLDEDGDRVRASDDDADDYSGSRFHLMDPANPEWQRFFAQRARGLLDDGWDGIFLDNVETSLAKREDLGEEPVRYPDDDSYRAAVEDFLVALRADVAAPGEVPVEANLIAMRAHDDPTWYRYLAHLDGAMDEAWAVGWSADDSFDVADWEADLERAERSQAARKHVWLVAQGEQDDVRRQRFAVASYLLVDQGDASFRYTNASAYDEVWSYPSYQRELGLPRGERERIGPRWVRRYEHGVVVVDPRRQRADITMHTDPPAPQPAAGAPLIGR